MEYQLDNGCLRLLVSSCGAQMQAIEKDGAQYLWDGNEEYWPERAPLLFPFVGRFTEGKYRLGRSMRWISMGSPGNFHFR